MGCSLSKDAESPSKGYKGTSSWDKVIQKRFTLQMNQSLKTTDGGYIAAIFSANYGILRKYAPVKMLEKKASLQSLPQEERYSTLKRSLAEKSDANASTNLVADTVLSVPMGSMKSESFEMLGTQKPAETRNENLETINILELMEGLSDEEVSANFDGWQASHEASNLSPAVNKQESSTIVCSKSSDEVHVSEALSANKVARRPRPKSFSLIDSIRSIENVDLALSARRGKTLLPLKSSRELRQQDNGEGFKPIRKTILDNNTKPQEDNIGITVRECRFTTSITTLEDASMSNTRHLQRALSFEYMLNDVSIKRQNSIEDAPTTRTNEETSTICRSGTSVFATTRFLYDGEGISFPSSPEFSAAASLKDRLPSRSHPSNLPDVLTYDTPISEMIHFFPPLIWEAEHTSISKVSESLCTTNGSNQWPNLECKDGPDIEEYGAPVFDPEMVESFENAMKHLSKEEWDAVRSMEDSPRNFLCLVKALKKSSSNSVRIRKGANLDFITMKANIEDCFERSEPQDGIAKIVEKKWVFMRQNSLEIGKTFSQVRAKDGMERASVVFYSSLAQVGSKAYEDCSQVRSILQSLVGICYNEKSISEHVAHEQELMHALNISAAVVPTLYVKGKYLVGIDSILHLYKKGMLGSMLREALVLGSKANDAMHVQMEQYPGLPTLQR